MLVGPAALRISGGTGTYCWSRVEFGAGEAGLDWRVSASADRCTVVARTVSHDGRISARDSVSVPARGLRSPKRTLKVDYLSAATQR